MPEQTDESVAESVQRGESRAFGVLIERYEPKLLRYAKKFLFDVEDAKDLVQEVFVKAYVNIQSFDVRRRFSPWIYRIAHNEFINAVKKKTRFPTFSFDLDTVLPHPVAPERADGDIERQEMRAVLEKGLTKLDAKYREPLVLYYFQELDYGEIAEVLKIPVSTVGVRLKRGKNMLSKKIMHVREAYE